MISVKDIIHLPYTRDLTEGGIAYALRSLPYTYNRMGGSSYDRLRRIAAEGHTDKDIYLFAFLSGLVAASQEDIVKEWSK